MILSDCDLRRVIEDGTLTVTPYTPERVQPSSIDLTLGSTFKTFTPGIKRIDPLRPVEMEDLTVSRNQIGRRYIDIPAGGFMLGTTQEHITLAATLLGRVEGKSSVARLGLAVHVTAGFIDPGFSGTITLEFANLAPAPIRLYEGMPIAQLAIHTLTSPAERPYGSPGLGSKYQGQQGTTASRYNQNHL